MCEEKKVIYSDNRIYKLGAVQIMHSIEMVNKVYPEIRASYHVYNSRGELVKVGKGFPIADFWELKHYIDKCEKNPFWVCSKWMQDNARSLACGA